ncbi:MAG: sulfotransferase family 2 domain-containing protein [Proteobacteria bacterium]|nr:sulfotransferase family 2 domain-containing protein [Pseudomonadota bacterium]
MISKQFKCIFVHIPKVAGQSIEFYFYQKLGLNRDNEEDRKELLLVNNKDNSCGTEKLSHLSATEYVNCGHISQHDFDHYFKFSFVRNPWARLVSEYRYRSYISHKSFKDFVMKKLPSPGWDDHYRHVMPQSEMLFDSDGQLLVDFVGKFEQIESDFKKVCVQLGFADHKLPHINSSNKPSREFRRKARNFLFQNGEDRMKSYVDFYDTETLEYVTKLYSSDITNFNYSFEDAL